MNNKCMIAFLMALSASSSGAFAGDVFTLGQADNSADEFALGNNRYKRFVYEDFGYEDTYYLVNHSKLAEKFPAVLPGPADIWGGTWGTAGWRTHDINVLFGLDKPADGKWTLVIDLTDCSKSQPPLLKVSVNDFSRNVRLQPGGSDSTIDGDVSNAREQILRIDIPDGVIRQGGNLINLNTLEGSWLMFDQLRLEGPDGAVLERPAKGFVRDVSAAGYQLAADDGSMAQPLLIDVEHLEGRPRISVSVDGREILSQILEERRYILEAPMPAVDHELTSTYRVAIDGKMVREGRVTRSPQRVQTLADYVDTRIGTAHSRWMIAPGPWMPFSMVKISPDNQNKGWQAGYQYSFENIGCFSHIHEWTMSGLGMIATNGKLIIHEGDESDPDSGYRSRVDRSKEEAPLDHYRIFLEDYGIDAEVTATTRCSFQRYTFPKDREHSRVLIDLHIPSEYDYILPEVQLRRVSSTCIEGVSHQLSRQVWSSDADQDYTIYFVIEFDKPMTQFGVWTDGELVMNPKEGITGKDLKDAGAFAEFDTTKDSVVQVRTGISLVSLENARQNLATEISGPFGWSFDGVCRNLSDTWNDLFNRLKITSNDRSEKMRFYNNMYRALCSRNTWSDVNGEWISADEQKRKLANPLTDVALGCDAFWNTFWNLNQFWNLVTPEWSGRWARSQLAMYDANGWLGKGPAGMEYIPVMVAEHEVPLIVGAYQMGIRDFDAEKAFEACRKMETTPAQRVEGGFAGNRDLEAFLKYKYVPMDLGRFSNTMEYAYDNWALGQFAKALGKTADYELFNDRASWWRNAINPKNGYCHVRHSDGSWDEPFDPITSHANHHYVEANAWQMSFFVPQDIPALVRLVGANKFADRLDEGFVRSDSVRYNAPNDQYWNYPVVQGNQQTMHMPFIYNYLGKPWLTQKWSRAVLDRYYGWGRANAYLGDEDQGQMSAWALMASIGLFQIDGGCNVNPVYEIASPLFEKIEIDLGGRYGRGDKFVIRAEGASRANKYVQSAMLNGRPLNSFRFPASELLNGGELVLKMGSKPNKKWGVEKF